MFSTQMEVVSLPFVKFLRSEATDELLKHPNCFVTMALIAQRARRDVAAFNPHGLQVGEALVGDYTAVGLSRQEFRTALANLQKWGLITTRPTTKGTIAKLCNSDVYDINEGTANQQSNQQSTSNQPAVNQQLTTKKNVRSKEVKRVAADAAPPSSLHQQFTAMYSDWYLAKVGVRPLLDGGDGKAVKELIQHLKAQSQSKSDEGALNGLRYILDNWDKQEDFYAKQHQLKQIKANINNVLAGIKKATTAEAKKPAPVSGPMTKADADALWYPIEAKPQAEPLQATGKSNLVING